MFDREAFIHDRKDRVGKALQDAYHTAAGRWAADSHLELIRRCIPMYRGLRQKFVNNPESASKMLFSETNTANLWYYPCDIIDLRQILTSRMLSWHAPIMLFSPKTARRLMPEYPICLVFDRSVAKDGITLAGLHLRMGNRLPIGSSLKRIMIRDYLTERQMKTISHIVRESMGDVPTYLMTDVPGIDGAEQRKSASTNEEIMSNWYSRIKQADGPSDTFGKEFLIGKQPKIPDPDIVETKYQLPHKALSIKAGDRVAYRYTNVKLPVNNESRSMPMTRSLVQNPKAGTIVMIDSKHIHIKWDSASEPQMVPVDQEMFLIKVSD